MPKIYGYTEILGDILITGSFSILGSASTIYSTSLVVSDTIITLGHSQSGSPILDEGIMFSRGTGLTQAFIWDETNDTFALVGTNDDHTLIGSINIDSYSNLKVGGLTTSNITITNGAANGYLLQSDASGNAIWASATSSSINFANTDLTLTGNRIHNTNGNDLIISTDGTGNDFAIGFLGTQSLSVGHVNYFHEFTSYDLSIQDFGGTRRLEINSTETIFGTTNNNFDFIIKGNTNENLFFVDASTDRVGIGTASLNYKLQVSGTVSTTGFRMTNGSSNGYILQSDASGNATWVAPGSSYVYYSENLTTKTAAISVTASDRTGSLIIGTNSFAIGNENTSSLTQASISYFKSTDELNIVVADSTQNVYLKTSYDFSNFQLLNEVNSGNISNDRTSITQTNTAWTAKYIGPVGHPIPTLTTISEFKVDDDGILLNVPGAGAEIYIKNIPTSSTGLTSGAIFTQTATQLGGSGTTKVICIV